MATAEGRRDQGIEEKYSLADLENNANQERVRIYKKKIEGELEKYCN